MKHAILAILASCVTVFITGCGMGGDEIAFEEYGGRIGVNGGKYEGIDGVTVIISKGVLEKEVTFTIFSIDTNPFTNVSATVTNIYSINPGAYKFKSGITVIIPYDEQAIDPRLDEVDLKPFFANDRKNFEQVPAENYELDLEHNIIKITTNYLGYFHIGFPKELVDKATSIPDIAEMIYIPEGPFDYGAPAATPTGAQQGEGVTAGEGTRQVMLSNYYIDKYEVSNAQYQMCQSAGVCTEPYNTASSKYPAYYTDPAYRNFPVIWVSWNQANTFCQWAGKRLPTEAEWEKAARGDSGMRKYPWGDENPADNAAATVVNYLALFEDVTDVTAWEKGASPYQVFNMAGNVAEWTDTWYDINSYYKLPVEEETDPVGPAYSAKINKKVIRGGSWVSLKEEITTYSRDKAFPHYRYYNLGFRCVKTEVK